MKIAIDAMGGDFGLDTTVKASMDAVKEWNDLELILFGDEEEIKRRLTDSTRITIVHTKNVLDMGEHNPVRAVRNNRDASLCMALRAGKNKEADAVVSNGPTQCVIVGAHLIIRRLKGMSRVALCPVVPAVDGSSKLMLDVGANISLDASQINELATYATVVSKEVFGIKKPTVGLLNIGTEEGKGRPQDIETYEMLEANPNVDFYGNIEPKEILTTKANVMVTDGFTGNMVLKTLEGVAKGIGMMLKEDIKSSLGGKIGYLLMKKNMAHFKSRLDPGEVGGAMILGIGTPVVKAHGSSDAYAYKNAIRLARNMVLGDVINKVVKQLPKKEVEA